MDIAKVPAGSPEQFNVVVEIADGSPHKYEYNKAWSGLQLNFTFRGGLVFLGNYGFIPHTRGGDNDDLDVVLLASHPILPLTVVSCKAVAMIELLDRGEVDNKIIAVPFADPLAERYDDLSDFTEEQLRGYEDFYREVAVQKNKIVEIQGFHGKARAAEEIARAIQAHADSRGQ